MTAAPGRTRWSHVLLAIVVALAAAAVLLGSVRGGLLAASFVPGGAPVTLVKDSIEVEDVAILGTQLEDAAGEDLEAIAIAIRQGGLDDLCASFEAAVPAGTLSVRATAPVFTARGISLTADSLSGEGLSFTDIVIGRDAAALQHHGAAGTPGMPAIEAATLEGDMVQLRSYTIEASQFAMSGLDFGVVDPEDGC